METTIVRCPLLRVDTTQRGRLQEIRDNLTERAEASRRRAGPTTRSCVVRVAR